MTFGLLKLAATEMIDTVAGILLVLTVGMCVVAFPFVLWMLFGSGPRSRHTHYTSHPRGNGTRGSSALTDDRNKGPQGCDKAEE
jgi:hypothetical protein